MSYNSLAESGLSGYGGMTDPVVQQALDDTERYLDALYGERYPGVLASTDIVVQPNLWPRIATDGSVLFDANKRPLTGKPQAIKDAEIAGATMILDGNVLLPDTVASASSASTQNRDITEKSVKVDDITTTTKWSASGTTTTTGNSVQTISDTGLPIIADIEAFMWPIISIGTTSSNNYYINRA